MKKIITLSVLLLGLVSVVGFTGFGIWHASSASTVFPEGGYILSEEDDLSRKYDFSTGEKYSGEFDGKISFETNEGEKVRVPHESFIHYESGMTGAFSDGILLDFNDLSNNFINNYYVTSGLGIQNTGSSYSLSSTSGIIDIGEHILKLSEKNYIIDSPSLTIHFSDEDEIETEGYVEISVTEDMVVHISTETDTYMTISPDCYIQTEGGVKIYPVKQIVDNDVYKLSLAKLSVSPDDAIKLTSDEVRRQIVPELKIEGIDGEDGEDGEDGKNGEEGLAGANGQAGTKGETGKKGEGGEGGVKGESGKPGSGGKPGKDAVIDSSTNSAIPTMTVADWHVSRTSLKGSLKINDSAGFLSAIADIPSTGPSKYPGSVKIIDVETGEVAAVCEQTTEIYDESNTISDFRDFYSGTDIVYFTTKGDPLKPDREYRLSVSGYYKAPGPVDMVYQREFISRVFTTDSTGVTASYEKAGENYLAVNVNADASLVDNIVSAQVFLLTPEQNKTFTLSSVSNTANYLASETITDFSPSVLKKTIKFDSNVTPNTPYVVRVVVENKGLTTLTNQELEVKSLKRLPVKKDEAARPSAEYNRLTGAFEVFRPAVDDKDNGAVSYKYTVYYMDGPEKKEKSTRTVRAGEPEPVQFVLDSERPYTIGIEMLFHDNEKQVEIDLGESLPVQAIGDTLPRIKLTKTGDSGQEYNQYIGDLNIDLGSNSSIKIDAAHPLVLEFYADKITNERVEIKNNTTVKIPEVEDVTNANMAITLTPNTGTSDNTVYSNTCNIKLDLKNLYKNTNYTITVSGYLSLGEGGGHIRRNIGSVSFTTYRTLDMQASWAVPENKTTAFARNLSLNVLDERPSGNQGEATIRENYAREQLMNGQVTVELFSGTGTGKRLLGQKNFNDQEDLEKLYNDGIVITENDFGSPMLNENANYTLSVSSVEDGSYNRNLGYVNIYDQVFNRTEIVSADPTPPDLLTDPTRGVIATPIINDRAENYGGSKNLNLPDDAVVGFTLESTYDNVQRIGKSITYYAFEYKAFFNALSNNQDPILNSTPLMKMTLPISTGSDSVPKVILWFGGTKTGPEDEPETFAPDYRVFYAGEPSSTADSLAEGMGRGFRYIFAYTVEYAGSSTGEGEVTRLYPYDHDKYEEYKKAYGGILGAKGNRLGKNVAYMLNSGMCEVPSLMPDLHSYVYSNTMQNPNDDDTMYSGTVELHYTYRDSEGLIKTGVGSDNTKIIYNFIESTPDKETVDFASETDKLDNNGWFKLNLPYTVSKGNEATMLLEPYVNISSYKIDYNSVLKDLNMDPDDANFPLAKIPVDWAWEKKFKKMPADTLQLQMDLSHVDENYINFIIKDGVQNGEYVSCLKDKATAFSVTLKAVVGGKSIDQSFLLPLSYDPINGLYAKLATGRLKPEFIGKNQKFTIENTVLYYDSGQQGWSVINNPDNDRKAFTIQYANTPDKDTVYVLDNYLGSKDNNLVPANYSMLTHAGINMEDFRATISKEGKKGDSKYFLSTRNLVPTGPDSYNYIYPSSLGVDFSGNKDPQVLSGRYAVPKKIASISIKPVSSEGSLENITPTFIHDYINTSQTEASFTNVEVPGFGKDGGSIKMAVFNNEEDARKLILNNELPAYKGTNIKIELVSDKYRPTSSSGEKVTVDKNNITISGLTANQTYYVAFYFENNGKDILLIDGSRGDGAVYEVVTDSGVNVKVKKLEYINSNYFQKELRAEFTMSRVYNVKMRYDIYSASSINGSNIKEGEKPLLSYETMSANKMVFDSIGTTQNNTVKIVLDPSEKRKAIVPGGTYYLVITPYEDTEGGPSKSIPCLQEFTIDPVGSCSAHIYVNNADSNSIDFRVTINDQEHALMGVKINPEVKPQPDPSNYLYGLYAVRFTDKYGNLLKTKNDNKIYSANNPVRRDFILNDSILNTDVTLQDNFGAELKKGIQPEQEYTIHIFGIPDIKHSGSVKVGDDLVTWDTFFSPDGHFGENGESTDVGTAFLKEIDSYWNGDRRSKTAGESAEAKKLKARMDALTIAKKVQKTTTVGGWLLNKDKVHPGWNGNNIRIKFMESVGLIKTDGTDKGPVFNKIIWQVDGMTDEEKPLRETGICTGTNGDKLLQHGHTGGGGTEGHYDFYYFDIPKSIPSGTYTIVMQFYLNETDGVPTETITVPIG